MQFSYLLCNYNQAEWLPRALGAIGREASCQDEIVIVDDGSTDNSLEVIERFSRCYPNEVKVRRLEKNTGLLAASSLALSESCGRYVGLYASDDHLLPGFGERARVLAARYPGAGVLAQEVEIRDEAGGGRRYSFGPRRSDAFLSPDRLSYIMKYRYFWLPTAAAFVRADALRSIGGWPRKLDFLADWYSVYSIAWKLGVAYATIPGAIIFERANSFGQMGMKSGPRWKSAVDAFFDRLAEPQDVELRKRFLDAPIALLAGLGGALPAFMASRPSDVDFSNSIYAAARFRRLRERIGSVLVRFL